MMSPENQEKGRHLQAYCLFIGHQRSGHSIVGALLDAHPHIVISHELHALECIKAGYDAERLFNEIITLSIEQAKAGRRQGDYLYAVPAQWQGRYRTLQVIGDKRGGASTDLLTEHPELIKRLQEVTGVDVKIIQVLRNPYDTIATMTLKGDFHSSGPQPMQETIAYYFRQEKTNAAIGRTYPEKLFRLHHESIIDDPKGQMKRLCEFLGVVPYKDYLDDCAAIVFNNPHKSRFDLTWSDDLIEMVKELLADYPYLNCYSYNE